jgi:hypothetical protein
VHLETHLFQFAAAATRARRHLVAINLAPRPVSRSRARAKRYTFGVRSLRYVSMPAAFVLIIGIALLCVALLALVGTLWAALHFGDGEEDED